MGFAEVSGGCSGHGINNLPQPVNPAVIHWRYGARMHRLLRPFLASAAITLIAAAPDGFDRAELDALEAERAAALAKLGALESAKDASAVDLSTVDGQLLAAAAESRRREEIAANAERKLIDLSTRLASTRTQLSEDEAAVKDLVAALIVQGNRRPPALIVSPDKANEAVRTAMLLSAITPRVQARTAELADEIDQLTKLQKQVRREQARLNAAEATLALKKEEIEQLALAKRAHYEDLSSEAEELRKKVAEISSKADSLKALVAGLEANAPSAPRSKPAPRIELAALDPSKSAIKKPVKPVTPVSKDLKPLGTAALGAMQRPATGLVARSWGDRTPGGGKAEGITIVTRADAQVVAPVDGRIEYAAPFRSYGQLLILRTSDGYHILLSGMGRIFGTPGQTVAAGEPVGRMADRASPPPELYMEVRRNGQPMNPAKWMKR